MNWQMIEYGFSKREDTTGKRIRDGLAEKGWSQAELARRASKVGRDTGVRVTPSDIHNYVYELCQPKMDKLVCIAKAMDKPTPWITGHAIEYKHV